MKIRKIAQLNLKHPASRNQNIPITRSWEREVIYHLMVDRFSDNAERIKTEYPDQDFSISQDELMGRYGGTIQGITKHITYLKNLGITCIWISPIFENYPSTYHGYGIVDFLSIDPKFGTLEEAKTLVETAHANGIRIILDIVINHTGNTWDYVKKNPAYNKDGYAFGKWHDQTFPLPHEFRNSDIYFKKGRIIEWDEIPETQEGDIFELKKIILDDSKIGLTNIENFIKIYSYWLEELNVDGYRLDTVKHIPEKAVQYFCQGIKSFAKEIGKDDFKIMGEALGDYGLIRKYWKSAELQHALDYMLDFPLHFDFPKFFSKKKKYHQFMELIHERNKFLFEANKVENNLVVFLDNHDQVAQSYKQRIGFGRTEEEVIALVGFLLFVGGIPCLYYGTEQHFKGNGPHDCYTRESFFSKSGLTTYHNEESFLFKKIAELIQLRNHFFHFVKGTLCREEKSASTAELISESIFYLIKEVEGKKIILIFNKEKKDSQHLELQISEFEENLTFNTVFGGTSSIKAECGYLKIDIFPLQFVILEQL